MSKISILIAEDQALIREGLKTMLHLQPDFEVVATAENGEQALHLVRTHQPRLVLLDIQMPVLNGIETVKRIKGEYPDILVIMLTTFMDEAYIIDSLAHGASGFLLKDLPVQRLMTSVREAIRGELMLPSIVAAALARKLQKLQAHAEHPLSCPEIDLSMRELEVARRMAQFKNNRQIAGELFISEGTVKNYVSVIYSKIGVSDRMKAVRFLKNLLEGEADV
ncbi:response regulator transcription factor [Paenibacillus sp. sptzw28]|uniref:response regulator transcription factor n=1 Tax=Paenibacillus sp. sptzw28 TaxID=715179 RepID=UPI001C6E2813|nr:response regulator transcription factor [Paenibacillus sp. sptzw28]QYR20280.1 response regulator transcription factor [Paenibacillus sp. sptzw28]